ncbi:MAG TPA: hypothetical protein DCE71_09050 [Parachlamydiales bacterium]|nr:hypothetical protein [Parachlamydiales bacterium]
MNEKDIKIRKQWLGLLVLSIVINSVSSLLQSRLNPALNQIPQIQYISFFIPLIISIVFGYALYHCIYKKPGTKLLTFCLIATAVSMVTTLLLFLTGKVPLPTYIPYYSVYLIASQILGVCWIVLCWKMLKINKRLKKLSSPLV